MSQLHLTLCPGVPEPQLHSDASVGASKCGVSLLHARRCNDLVGNPLSLPGLHTLNFAAMKVEVLLLLLLILPSLLTVLLS